MFSDVTKGIYLYYIVSGGAPEEYRWRPSNYILNTAATKSPSISAIQHTEIVVSFLAQSHVDWECELLCSTELYMDPGHFFLLLIPLLNLTALPNTLVSIVQQAKKQKDEAWKWIYHICPLYIGQNIVTWSHLVARQAGKCGLLSVTQSFVITKLCQCY